MFYYLHQRLLLDLIFLTLTKVFFAKNKNSRVKKKSKKKISIANVVPKMNNEQFKIFAIKSF